MLGIHLPRFLAIRRVQYRQGEVLAHVVELAQRHRPLRACRAAIGRSLACTELEHGKRRHLAMRTVQATGIALEQDAQRLHQ